MLSLILSGALPVPFVSDDLSNKAFLAFYILIILIGV